MRSLYTRIGFVLLLVVWALGARGLTVWRTRPIRHVMNDYLRAAAARDSAALERISGTSYPVHWALTAQREVPAFIDAARGAHLEWIDHAEDTVIASFRLTEPIPDPECTFRPLETLQGKFLKGNDGKWRIIRVAVPVC